MCVYTSCNVCVVLAGHPEALQSAAYNTLPSHLQACKIVLQLPGSSEGVKGYNELCRAIVILMSCGIGYTRQTEDVYGRVLVSIYTVYGVCIYSTLAYEIARKGYSERRKSYRKERKI